MTELDSKEKPLSYWVGLALAPTWASPLLLAVVSVLPVPVLLLYPLIALAYLSWLGARYVESTPLPRFSVFTFVILATVVNVGLWGAGCLCILANLNLGNMH